MKLRLFWTMLLAFALVIVLSVCGMLGFIGLGLSGQWQPQALRENAAQFQHAYVLSLGDFYLANGESWGGIEQRFDALSFGGPNSMFGSALADTNGRVVASNDRNFPLGLEVSVSQLERGIPVEAHGLRVGTLLLRAGMRNLPDPPVVPPLAPRTTRDIVWTITRSFLVAALSLAGALLLLAVVFAQRISRPLRRLTAAARQLATGQLDVHVAPARIREVDELTEAFNGMAQSLAAADRQRRQMTADIAHELRTPLTIIKGRLEGLQDGVYSATSAELDRLLGETALLERLIEDLRLLALADAGQLPLYREVIDPRDLLEGARSAFAGQAAMQQIALQVDLPDNLPQIDVDPQRLAQVLANLVSNALRYTPEGGRITLGAIDRAAGGSLPPAGNGRLPAADSIVLTVSDTGPGIPAAELPNIFERFYRADRSRARSSGGTGLGLAIARQIVVAHSGTIWADSIEGQGTTFSIALPLALESVPA